MSYRALYRDYRPQKFADIVGQQHITHTLQNAVLSGRISHAYLFCGPRGTGKTTTAKVLAKTLNCLDRSGKEPCNKCANCTATTDGTSVDVIEIDAASNRGIEDIRDLREKVKYSPTHGKYRIYIIDEVHMLTAEAFNALLKTLEEPPAHVIFVLATTEPQKVPVTILSRCQRFEFHRINVGDMIKRLKTVAESAGLKIEDQALILISRAAEGGLRDALSILDQSSVFGNNTITADDIHNLLGTVREDVLSMMARYLADHNAGEALKLVNELYQQGKDMRLFVRELNSYLRAIMLSLISKDITEEHQRANIQADAEKFNAAFIAECLEILARLEYDMKWSSQPRLLLELALVKITAVEKDDIKADRLVQTDEQDRDWQSEKKQQEKLPSATGTKEQTLNEANTEISAENVQNIDNAWNDILERVKRLKPSVYGVFREAKAVHAADHTMTIGFKPQHSNFHKMRAEQSDNKKIFEQAVSEVYGGSWKIKIITVGEQAESKTIQPEEAEHPLVQKAIEFFGKDKVVITKRN